jgi:3'-phosphoadenosine 5'-phosphosulfate sulfotransferase (PAPS reductase)/FAD synthetase
MSDLLAGGDAQRQDLLADAFSVLDQAEAEHSPRARFALFSGGHELSAAHIRTGTGIPQTTEYVQQTCAAQGWALKVYEPPVRYEEIVLEYGFPGPGQHGLMYQRLKERCLRMLVREHKEVFSDRIMLVTGVRSEESVRRMRHVERIQREGAQVWAADIWNWSKLDCNRFIAAHALPRNPVVDMLHMSGECLCGAFARPGEISEIEMWFPDHAAWLHDLEDRVRAVGLRGCVWGQRPPRIHREQMALTFGDEWDAMATGPLCIGCGADDERPDDDASDATGTVAA